LWNLTTFIPLRFPPWQGALPIAFSLQYTNGDWENTFSFDIGFDSRNIAVSEDGKTISHVGQVGNNSELHVH